MKKGLVRRLAVAAMAAIMMVGTGAPTVKAMEVDGNATSIEVEGNTFTPELTVIQSIKWENSANDELVPVCTVLTLGGEEMEMYSFEGCSDLEPGDYLSVIFMETNGQKEIVASNYVGKCPSSEYHICGEYEENKVLEWFEHDRTFISLNEDGNVLE